MVQHVLLLVDIHFHLNLFIFEFILIFLIFILAAILKWRPFCPTDSDLFGLSRSTRCGCDKKHYCKNLCEVNIFCTLVEFFSPPLPPPPPPPPKSCHTLRWIFLQSFMKLDERNPIFFLIPPFLFPWQLRQSCLTDSKFGLSRST